MEMTMRASSKIGLALIAVISILICAQASLSTVSGQLISEQPVDCIKADRKVIVDRFGTLYVSDSYVFENVGNETLSHVVIFVQKNAENIVASDFMGFIIPAHVYPLEGNIAVYVFPRYSFNPSERTSFTLSYTIPARDYLRQSSIAGRYVLRLSLQNVTLFHRIGGIYTSITLPEGASIVSSTSGFTHSGTKLGGMTVSGFADYDPASSSFEPVIIEYDYVLFWAAFYPLIWVSIPLMLVYGAIILPKLRRLPTPKVTVPLERILDFIRTYEEKLSLLTEEEDIEEDLVRGKVKRHEYLRRVETIRQRSTIVDRNLAILKEKVRELGGKYAELVNKIEATEARFLADKASLKQIEDRFRAGQISRNTYSALVSDVVRRTEEDKKAISQALILLRQELG